MPTTSPLTDPHSFTNFPHNFPIQLPRITGSLPANCLKMPLPPPPHAFHKYHIKQTEYLSSFRSVQTCASKFISPTTFNDFQKSVPTSAIRIAPVKASKAIKTGHKGLRSYYDEICKATDEDSKTLWRSPPTRPRLRKVYEERNCNS